MKRTAAAAILATLVFALGAASVQAQTGAPMTITFVRPAPEYQGVQAYIGTTLCGEVDFDESSELQVGGPGTPAVCNEVWRVVELVASIDDVGYTLFITPVFEPGSSLTIENFVPPPAVDGPDVHFGIAVFELTPELRDALTGLTAYVGDAHCGTAAIREQSLWLSVSSQDAPAACREYGAAITLFDRNGHALVVSPTVGVGPYYTLENFAPYPPGAGPAMPSPTSPGDGAPSPAIAGDGGIPDPSRGLVPWVGLGVAVALLGLARRGAHAP